MKNISFRIFFGIIAFVLLYLSIKFILLQTLNYKNVIILRDMFSKNEIEQIQSCIGNKDEIQNCFTQCQSTILQRIQSKLNAPYMHVGLARLSNNNNNDAQSFHRDIKPAWYYKGPYPNVYTIICYFDEASLSMGNETILSKPGDIVIFNSTNLHKANNISLFQNKQRRVLQFFHVFFDKTEQENFYKNNSFCEHIDGTDFMRYFTYLFDIKFLFEYFNISRIINDNDCNTPFSTNIQHTSYITTINGIDYYHYF
jgi:hypothetical protein